MMMMMMMVMMMMDELMDRWLGGRVGGSFVGDGLVND